MMFILKNPHQISTIEKFSNSNISLNAVLFSSPVWHWHCHKSLPFMYINIFPICRPCLVLLQLEKWNKFLLFFHPTLHPHSDSILSLINLLVFMLPANFSMLLLCIVLFVWLMLDTIASWQKRRKKSTSNQWKSLFFWHVNLLFVK